MLVSKQEYEICAVTRAGSESGVAIWQQIKGSRRQMRQYEASVGKMTTRLSFIAMPAAEPATLHHAYPWVSTGSRSQCWVHLPGNSQLRLPHRFDRAEKRLVLVRDEGLI